MEEVKLYDFDWTVPPEIINKQTHNNKNNTGDETVMTIQYWKRA